MKKRYLILPLLGAFALASCGSNSNTPTTTTPVETAYYDNQNVYDSANPTAVYDHYYSNKLTFADTGTTVAKKNGKLAGDFIKDGVARMALKSYTDGDTAVFYVNKFDTSATQDASITVKGKTYPYVTIRFLGIDTPESTSSIDPWGKEASKYGKKLLTEAAGIIVDASDKETNPESNYEDRLDSNGTRWLGLVWYCPKGKDPENLSNYRSYQLDLIEECYSFGCAFSSSRLCYTASKDTEPIMYNRYKEVTDSLTGETEKRYGSLTLNELFFEASNRMSRTGATLRIQGEIDEHYDYSKTPTIVSITDVIKNINEHPEENYLTKGTYVQVTGVISRFVGTNLYIQDKDGTPLYIYMGIDGNSISNMFNQGDTISIRGRICEYGGQYQMSGVVFKPSTFKKVEGADAVAMPEPIDLDAVKAAGKLDVNYVKSIVGQLVTYTITVKANQSASLSKDGAYSLNDTYTISGLNTSSTYDSDKCLQVRINGNLAPGYDLTMFGSYTDTMKGKLTGGTYKVTGIMGIYQEDDYTKGAPSPSYQIVVGNRPLDANGEVVNEIVKQ